MTAISPSSATDPNTWLANSSTKRADAAAAVASDASTSETGVSAKADVGQQFEAMFLRQMLEEVMPKSSETLYGKGTSGSAWRSMLADHMATSISKTGSLGIAPLIAKSDLSQSEVK